MQEPPLADPGSIEEQRQEFNRIALRRRRRNFKTRYLLLVLDLIWIGLILQLSYTLFAKPEEEEYWKGAPFPILKYLMLSQMLVMYFAFVQPYRFMRQSAYNSMIFMSWFGLFVSTILLTVYFSKTLNHGVKDEEEEV
jgi:hypothetical protein